MDEFVFSEDKSKPLTINDCEWKTLSYGDHQVGLYVPDPELVRRKYDASLVMGKAMPFPYWAHLWPAAMALCAFMAEYPDLIRNQRVLELAGGLGLPSLFAAEIAATICYSDHSAEAVEVVKESAARNDLKHLKTEVIDWNHLPDDPPYDIVLMSDVNYDPQDLPGLKTLFEKLLVSGMTILLSTPERIVAADLLNELMPFVRSRSRYEPMEGRFVHVMLLAQSDEGLISSR
jgi:predicted nicotinamide N-methyase